MSNDLPEEPLTEWHGASVANVDSVELHARRDPIALVLELLRTASAIAMAVALIVIAAELT